MKKFYEAPELVALNVEATDCISASGVTEYEWSDDGLEVNVNEIL